MLAELKALEKDLAARVSVRHGLAEIRPVDLKLNIRGNPHALGDAVPRGFPAILGGTPLTRGSGRLELAEAIVRHPLAARVIANRVWMHHFGRGIVATPSNFGRSGDRPTHPELLDYLASRLVENGWSIKALHREIMLSAAYQLSAERRRRIQRGSGEPLVVARQRAAPGRRVPARFAALRRRQSRRRRGRSAGGAEQPGEPSAHALRTHPPLRLRMQLGDRRPGPHAAALRLPRSDYQRAISAPTPTSRCKASSS